MVAAGEAVLDRAFEAACLPPAWSVSSAVAEGRHQGAVRACQAFILAALELPIAGEWSLAALPPARPPLPR
jgi:hypothetical protein